MNYDECKLAKTLDKSTNNQIPPQESPASRSKQATRASEAEIGVEVGAEVEVEAERNREATSRPEFPLLATASDNYSCATKTQATNSLPDRSFVSGTTRANEVIEKKEKRTSDKERCWSCIGGGAVEEKPFGGSEKMIMTIRGGQQEGEPEEGAQEQVMDEQKVCGPSFGTTQDRESRISRAGADVDDDGRQRQWRPQPPPQPQQRRSQRDRQDSEADNSKSVGQLVLNVDFAPPRHEQLLERQKHGHNHQIQQQQQELKPQELHLSSGERGAQTETANDYNTQFCQLNSSCLTTTSHLIEVSLCIKQRRPSEEEEEEPEQEDTFGRVQSGAPSSSSRRSDAAPVGVLSRDVDYGDDKMATTSEPDEHAQETVLSSARFPREDITQDNTRFQNRDKILPLCDNDFKSRLEMRLGECAAAEAAYQQRSSNSDRVDSLPFEEGCKQFSGDGSVNSRASHHQVVQESNPSSHCFANTNNDFIRKEEDNRMNENRVPTNVGSSNKDNKQRLVYERIDKFSLEIGNIVSATTSRNGRPILPFKNGTFDACFCFNLLNLRVSSSANINSNQLDCACAVSSSSQTKSAAKLDEAKSEADGEVTVNRIESGKLDQVEEAKRWLRMERLTTELRLELLNELSRVVKSKGKSAS